MNYSDWCKVLQGSKEHDGFYNGEGGVGGSFGAAGRWDGTQRTVVWRGTGRARVA